MNRIVLCFLFGFHVLFFSIGCSNPPTSSESSSSEKAQDAGDTSPERLIIDQAPQCRGNNDGIIDRTEFTYAIGVSVNVLRNQPGSIVAVDHVGKVDEKGIRIWDFRETQATTQDTVRTVDPTGKWFLSSFPQANLLIPTSFSGMEGTVYQVLRYTEDMLLLQGIASEQDNPETQRVLLPYDQPIPLLRFPLQDGKEWVVNASTQGKVGTLPLASTDTYQIRVVGRGSVKLPNIQFDNALRIFITVRQRFIGGQTRQLYQILFFHECFGEIARIESKDNETNEAFDRATLLRFISF